MKNFFSSHKKRSLPHVLNGRFYNYPEEKSFPVLFPSLYMYFRSLFERILHPYYDLNDWMVQQKPVPKSIDPVITWIGHATFLLQIGGLNILTDPIFCSPSIFYKRILPPGVLLDQLPHIDGVVISHNHPDHMSSVCLKNLERKFQPYIFVPQKVGTWFRTRKFSDVHEFTWWQKMNIPAKADPKENVDIYFLPSRHWSQRGLFDRNRTLWGSWMISYKGYHIYFAGDTGYAEHFAEIGQEFKTVNSALLPIGPGEPHELLHHSHMDARQAIQAFFDLNAQEFIPMHWGTFHFGTDHFYRPIEHLLNVWHGHKEMLQNKVLCITKVGEQLIRTLSLSENSYQKKEFEFVSSAR